MKKRTHIKKKRTYPNLEKEFPWLQNLLVRCKKFHNENRKVENQLIANLQWTV